MPTAYCVRPTAYSLLTFAFCPSQLPPVYCLLLIAFRLPTITKYLQYIAYCLLHNFTCCVFCLFLNKFCVVLCIWVLPGFESEMPQKWLLSSAPLQCNGECLHSFVSPNMGSYVLGLVFGTLFCYIHDGTCSGRWRQCDASNVHTDRQKDRWTDAWADGQTDAQTQAD